MTSLQQVTQDTCRSVRITVSEVPLETREARVKLTELYIIQNLIVAAMDSSRVVKMHLEDAATSMSNAIALQERLAK